MVYDEERQRVVQMKLGDSVLAKMEDTSKAFFSASWTGTTWVLRDRVEDPGW